MIDYSLTVTLKLKGPIMTKSTAAGNYGIDASFTRNEKIKLCLPLDLVKGRLRQAMTEINEAVGNVIYPPEWFGKGSDENIGSYTPERGLLNFTDFIYDGTDDNKDNRIFRIRIDNERGSVQQGAYQVIEAPFQTGEEADFKGTINFFAANQNQANDIGEKIRQGFCWITSFGSQKSIGFGQLISVDVSQPQQVQPHVSISTNIAADQTHFDLVVKPLALFCLTNKRIDQNLFESDDIISGGALKGSIATTWLKYLGQNGEIRDGIDNSRPELCRNFEKIRFTHAFPVRQRTRTRPVAVPYSTVIDKDNRLHDMALFSNPVLINGSAPAFFMDWKNKVWEIANAKFGWNRPKHKLDVHHQHDREKRKAKEAQLFAFDAVDPQEHEWRCTVDLSRVVDAAERVKVGAQLQDFLRYELKDLGKTKSTVKVEWQAQSVITPTYQSNPNPREGLWIITLQTPALICDPKELDEISGADELRTTYENAWLDLSEELMVLERYFAGQHLVGGKYLHNRFQSSKPYNPFLLTDAGSVFVLKQTGDEQKAKAKIEAWLLYGLPLPSWSVERYRRNGEDGDHWNNCPYIPENGYGEITVNLDVHWERNTEDVYDEV